MCADAIDCLTVITTHTIGTVGWSSRGCAGCAIGGHIYFVAERGSFLSEHDLQCAVAQYLDLRKWLWCAVPNGGNRNIQTAQRLKREGVKRGVPDILIFEAWREHLPGRSIHEASGHGVAIELKSPGKYPTKEQREWLAALKARGWLTHVCRTIHEVEEVCKILQGRNDDD